MKKIVMLGILLTSFILIVPQICFSDEPPPCGTSGWTLIGPPVVGTFVVDYVSGSYPYYNLSVEFKGCCADCFENCKSSCNVRIKWTENLPVMPEGLDRAALQNLNLGNRGPKNCNPIVDGNELKDLVIETILTFDKSDIDGDGYKELVAKVVMYYWVCN